MNKGKQKIEYISKQFVGFWVACMSALAAAFGVQKKQNLKRDFTQGNPAHYIAAGVACTFLLIVALLTLVYHVSSSG